LVNAMGLNSPGIAEVVSRLAGLGYPVFISVAGFSAEDFFTQLIYLQRHYRPAAVEVNISSPTYRGLWRDLPRLVDVDLPIFIKIGPGTNMPLVVKAARRMGWGLVVTNTFPVEDRRISVGRGGLSGLLVYKYGVRMLGRIRGLVGPDTPIIYSGGLFTCSQLREVLKLANAAEALTSILYFTPFVLKLLNQCPDIV